jgi:hypothetical protein
MSPGNENLAKPVKADIDDLSRVPPGFYPSLVFGILGVIAAFLVGYAYERHLSIGFSLWATIAASLFFIAFSVLQMFLVKRASRRAGFIFLETVAAFLPFVLSHHELFMLGAVAAFFLFLLWGYFESRSECDYGTEIRFFKMTHAVAAKTVTALLLFAVFFLVLTRGSGENFFMSQSSFAVFYQGGAAVFAGFYPGVSVNGSFQDFSQSVAEEQLSAMPAFRALSPGEQAVAVQNAAGTLTANFSHSLGVSITPTSTTSGVVYDFIVQSLANWHARFGVWFVAGWAGALFIILRSFGVIFILIAQFFAMILYEILLSAGTVRVVEHPQTKEEVEFM